MKWLAQFLRLSNRLRYWRLRALQAERELVEVKAQAEAERWRNVMREDTMVSVAAILGGRAQMGLPPRYGPAELSQPHRLANNIDPWTATTAIERMEFQTQWVPLGIERGYSMQRMQQDFLRELQNRKQFNDEPSM